MVTVTKFHLLHPPTLEACSNNVMMFLPVTFMVIPLNIWAFHLFLLYFLLGPVICMHSAYMFLISVFPLHQGGVSLGSDPSI